MQHSNDRKHAIYKRIKETRNKKRKTSAVGLTTENQSVVAETITGFMNLQIAYNESGINVGNPLTNGNNDGANIKAAAIVNHQEQTGGQNSNNRDNTSKISYAHFGNNINRLPKGLENVTVKEVSMVWEKYNIITSSVYRIINSNQREIHNINYKEGNIFRGGCQTDIDNHAYTYCFGRNV